MARRCMTIGAVDACRRHLDQHLPRAGSGARRTVTGCSTSGPPPYPRSAMAVMLAGNVGHRCIFLVVALRALMPDARGRNKRPIAGRLLVRAARLSQNPNVATRRATATRRLPMDWDEIGPRSRRPTRRSAKNSSTLSVGELEARIAEFEREIERVKTELDEKRRHEMRRARCSRSDALRRAQFRLEHATRIYSRLPYPGPRKS